MPGKAADWRKDLDSHRMNSLDEMFAKPKPVIGMVHLPPLPGSVGYTGYPMSEIIDFALKDAATLEENGVDGLIVENMWNIPFAVGMQTSPEEMCAQAVAAAEVVKAADIPVGINVVHNGARVCLGLALASGARFIRVCLLTGAAVWDTGEFDHGCARELLSARKLNQAEHIKLFCDVDKKHSVRFPGIDLETHIEWTEFYLADAMIITGRMTGNAPDLEKVKKAKELAKGRPILMGSGMTAGNVAEFLKIADGCIVGFGMKDAGHPYRPVNPDNVKQFMDSVESIR